MGTKMPPPPTPPTVPNADPRNPIMLPTIIFHPNFILYNQKQKHHKVNHNAISFYSFYLMKINMKVFMIEKL